MDSSTWRLVVVSVLKRFQCQGLDGRTDGQTEVLLVWLHVTFSIFVVISGSIAAVVAMAVTLAALGFFEFQF